MPNMALALGAHELRPLVEVPSYIDSAIDAVESVTVSYHQGKVRERNLVDERSTSAGRT